MSNITNISDLYPSTGGALLLPIRSEKVIHPELAINDGSSDPADMVVSSALPPHLPGYVSVRIPGRDPANPGVFSTTHSALFYFLINPSEVSVTRQTVSEQTYTRSGWQIGVSGEDFISISMNGKTAGKYYYNGTTDFFSEFSLSYRNLLALEIIVENNGYWFEGEQMASTLAAPQGARRIKMHTDIEITVGEFIWHGMFESFEITEDADSPFLADFNLVFIAWKETFNRSTPYPNSIGGEIQRGHVPSNLRIQQAIAPSVDAQALSGTTETSSTLSTQVTDLNPLLHPLINPQPTTNSTLSTLIMNPESAGF